MSDAIFWRLIWKEYRLQRAFFAAIVVLAIAVQILGILSTTYQGGELPVEFAYLIAAGAVAMYALGCGATLFATEHESGTFDFQRSLPITAARLFCGKIAFAIGSTLLLSLLVWIVTVLVSRGVMPPAGRHLEIWCAGAVAALEMLAWGVFFSLILRQPLLAAILGITMASVIVHVVVPSFSQYHYTLFGQGNYLDLLPQRCLAGIAILALDAAIGFRWFHGISLSRWRIAPATADTPHDGEVSAPALLPTFQSWRALGSLIWHTWQQGKRLLITCSVLYFVAVAWPWISLLLRNGRVQANTWRGSPNGLEAMFWLVPLAALFGCGTFLLDQTRQQFRFFAERGTRPRLVWASRHFVWGGVLFLLTGIACAYAAIILGARGGLLTASETPGESARLTVALLSAIVLSYAAGQACAMFLRSPVLGITLGLATAAALCGWVVLMTLARIPWLWSVAPIPVFLLFATWLRTPDWVLERSGLRARVQAVLSVVVPLGVVACLATDYRVDEVPVQSPGFSLAEFDQPLTDKERASSELYVSAFRSIVPFERPPKSEQDEPTETVATPNLPPQPEPLDFSQPARALFEREEQWVTANEKAIRQLLDASRKPSAVFFDPHSDRHYVATSTGQTISFLLLASAKERQAQGELDAAWERYLAILHITRHAQHRGAWSEHVSADGIEQLALEHITVWAAVPDQSSERLLGALKQLKSYSKNIPSRDSALKYKHYLTRRYLMGDSDLSDRLTLTPDDVQQQTLELRLMPWERSRALRLLNFKTHESLRHLETARDTLTRGDTPQGFTHENWNRHQSMKWLNTTPLLQRLNWHMVAYQGVEAEFIQTTMRRAGVIQLALQAWQRDHDQLPTRLADLKNEYLDPIPVDPFSGQPFRYFPAGRPEKTQWGMGAEWRLPGRDHRVRVVPEDRPFIWSAGPAMPGAYYVEPGGKRLFLISDNYGNQFRAVSEAEALMRGWAFALPEG